MGLLVASSPAEPRSAPGWRNPAGWLREKSLNRGYWVFFSAAFFYDAGFSVYFFLFNLYLLDCGFNERAMGWIGGAFTLGSVLGTLPAGVPARKLGLRPLLIVLFVAAPVLSAARALWMWEPAQIGLAFLTGLVMCTWGVCFLPAVARLTEEKNRASGFSLIFSVSVGTSMLGGIMCGYLRDRLAHVGIAMQPAEVKRLILLASCGIALIGFLPVLRLRVPAPREEENDSFSRGVRGRFHIHPFLWRFLPLMALWSAVLAAFTPFANVFLVRDLHISMTRIGLIFTAVQLVQLCMGLAAPLLFRTVGLMNGIFVTQAGAAAALFTLASAQSERTAITLYLTYSAAQWASSPGLYNLLMNEVPDRERSSAAAMTMFANAVSGSAATALTGVMLTRSGYPLVMMGLAGIALSAALLLRFLVPCHEKTAEEA